MEDKDNAAGMDADEATKRFTVNVLQTLNSAQNQHGLRQDLSDYQRYRSYCASRLRRLHKSLKFLHGRGRYVRKAVDPAMVTDVRYLHIPLYNAERAWSYAMEMKKSAGGPDARQRLHLIRRLAKAAKWADLFAKLCSEKADSRSALEAEAYASWMWGNVLLERENDWETAASKFARARAVYEQLGKVGDVENQVLCRRRVEENMASIRYCRYKMGKGALRDTDLLELGKEGGPTNDLLQSKLEAVMEDARAQQASAMSELEWQGRQLPVRSSKTRMCILRAQELEKEFQSTSTPLTNERKLTHYDKIFVAYQDAKKGVRDDLSMAGGDAAPSDVREELRMLDTALTSVLLERTISRNLLLADVARSKLERQQQGRREDKPARPEDLVRLYDILTQNVSDLADMVSSYARERQEDGVHLASLNARKTLFQASRCFYLAQSYATAGKFSEAYVLFGRAREQVEASATSLSKLKKSDEMVLEEAKSLVQSCRAQRCLVHARGCAEAAKAQDGVQKAVSAISLKASSTDKPEQRFLLDALDDYVSAVGPANSKEAPRVAQIPPPFQAIPCRPMVIDTALDEITFPSLESLVKKEVKKGGLFSSFWRN